MITNKEPLLTHHHREKGLSCLGDSTFSHMLIARLGGVGLKAHPMLEAWTSKVLVNCFCLFQKSDSIKFEI